MTKLRNASLSLFGLLLANGLYDALLWPRRPVGYFSDDALYILAARSILQGKYVALQIPVHPPLNDPLPGFPLLLSPFVALLQPQWDSLKFISLLLTLGSVYFLWRLARVWLDLRPALAATAIFALNAETARWSVTVLSEPAFIFMGLGSLLWLYRLLQHGGKSWEAWGLGLLLGWISLVRPQGIVFTLGASAALYAAKDWKRLARIVPVSLGIWSAVLLRNYHLTHSVTGYVSSLQESLAMGIETWLRHGVRVIKTLLIDMYGAAIPMPPGLGWILRLGLGGGIFFLGTRGVRRLLKRPSKNRPLGLAIGVSAGAYLFVHMFWHTTEPRYFLPLLPFMTLFLVSGWQELAAPWKNRIAVMGGGLLLIFYAANAALALRESAQGRTAKAPGSYGWIRDHTPAGSFFLSANASELALWTGRYAAGAVRVRNEADFEDLAQRLHITYVFVRPGRLLSLGFTNAFWAQMEVWTRQTPHRFQLVYQDADEGVRIYQIQPASSPRQ